MNRLMSKTILSAEDFMLKVFAPVAQVKPT